MSQIVANQMSHVLLRDGAHRTNLMTFNAHTVFRFFAKNEFKILVVSLGIWLCFFNKLTSFSDKETILNKTLVMKSFFKIFKSKLNTICILMSF